VLRPVGGSDSCGFRPQGGGWLRPQIRLKILSAEFVTSAAAGGRADGIPRDGRLQIALAGRSNVGKSTLINALCRKKIARTSAAPGKTRLANVYRIGLEGGGGPGRWEMYLVDLPGYGYARGGAESAQELAAVAEAYFAGVASVERESGVSSTLLLIDSRHPGLAADLHAHEWLIRAGTSPHIIGTKVDKLSRAERARNFTALQNVFGTAALPVSAQTGEGLDDVWKLIIGHRRTQTHTEKPAHTEEPMPQRIESGNTDKTEDKR
jgi:GTP-binding protein